MVIDGDMNVFPAAMKLAAAATIGTRNYAGEAAQLLNIEVEQIAGSRVFIANQKAQPVPDRACGSDADGGECGSRWHGSGRWSEQCGNR